MPSWLHLLSRSILRNNSLQTETETIVLGPSTVHNCHFFFLWQERVQNPFYLKPSFLFVRVCVVTCATKSDEWPPILLKIRIYEDYTIQWQLTLWDLELQSWKWRAGQGKLNWQAARNSMSEKSHCMSSIPSSPHHTKGQNQGNEFCVVRDWYLWLSWLEHKLPSQIMSCKLVCHNLLLVQVTGNTWNPTSGLEKGRKAALTRSSLTLFNCISTLNNYSMQPQ